ncbi:hypothetical protein D3C72_1381450 [compost metagenome]
MLRRLYLYDSAYTIGLSVAARLLLDTTTRGGCGRLRSSRNSFCAGLDSTR